MSSLRNKWRLPNRWLRALFLALTTSVALRVFWIVSLSEDALSTEPGSFIASPLLPNGGEMITIRFNNETFYKHSHFLVHFPLCLVHVGKAAGSSVSCGLGLTYADCEGMPRDRLPHTHFFHMRRNNCPPGETRTYAVTLRNPITRLQSWFDFEKDIVPTRGKNVQEQQQVQARRGMLFQECYRTFEQLVEEGLEAPPNVTVTAEDPRDMNCQERAWAAVLGVRAFSYHEWYNYEYYWTAIQQQGVIFPIDRSREETATPSRSMYALRTEHLSDDWKTLSHEPLFRPVNRRKKVDRNTTTTTRHSSPSFLSDAIPQARQQLCHALCPEIQYYKRFLTACQNLSPAQRQQSLQEVQDYCPLETSLDVRDCPNIPEFPKMRVPGRQFRVEVKKRLYEKII